MGNCTKLYFAYKFGRMLWNDLNQQRLLVKSLVLPAKIISNPELPQRVNEPISTVINEEHLAEIKLQLILRGSRDYFHPKTFWNMCNGHAGTVVITKVSGTEEILGGYNPLAWDNSIEETFMETKNGFIFSLKNGNVHNSELKINVVVFLRIFITITYF
ncbi:hypothetical protein Glove_736g12 [Diversispora epigaea]|uniref:TLDc domain-containing protein n=1 Tax=Diversispora epigaea TaxID=1348612 RepID=A0A397G0V6_9GLOM|nr:hypothetical protein Glove_736g12 [Diversispora epigaea]